MIIVVLRRINGFARPRLENGFLSQSGRGVGVGHDELGQMGMGFFQLLVAGWSKGFFQDLGMRVKKAKSTQNNLIGKAK
jgi:hypothetical protein